MTRLSVNLNKVALLRNARPGNVPSVTAAARAVLDVGADGITVHPRPDQRHIRPGDVDELAKLVRERSRLTAASTPRSTPTAELNIEGNPFEGPYLEIVRWAKPDQCTLVPDTPGQNTSDHGWDVAANTQRLIDVVGDLHALGCRVSLFMDPDPAQIDLVGQTGADRVELYTEGYAKAYAQGGLSLANTIETYRAAANRATDLGLGVNAGHDLNLDNLGHFLTIPNIAEVSIGHALIAEALHRGLKPTVQAYLAAIS